MTTPQIKIDPKAIQTNATKATTAQAKGQVVSGFDTMMGSVNAMGPFAGELSYGLSGDPTASSVISAAFNSFPAAASAIAGGGYGMGGGMPASYPSYARGFAMNQSDAQVGGISGAGAFGSQAYSGVSGGNAPIAGTATTSYDLMQTMNQNNLQLLELQAVMQSNMQQWTTKSNVLSADHRAKMSIMEKFTARG